MTPWGLGPLVKKGEKRRGVENIKNHNPSPLKSVGLRYKNKTNFKKKKRDNNQNGKK